MNIFWDSSAMTCRLVLDHEKELKEYEWEAGRTLARDMLAYLRDKLAENNSDFSDIKGIGVNQGPGSFTGLRIGLTVLNTIANTYNIPIVGASGDGWLYVCRERLSLGESDKIVLPEYGGEANITKPRK